MEAGKRAGWSFPYVGDRPRDILGLTKAQEATISQFIGFSGVDQDGVSKDLFILVYIGTEAPTLTDYAATPLNTIVYAPLLTHSTIFIHRVKSETPVIGDWEKIVGETVT